METRVIVANNARGRIFASHDVLNHLVEQEDFVHAEAHLSNQELVSDAPGSRAIPMDPSTRKHLRRNTRPGSLHDCWPGASSSYIMNSTSTSYSSLRHLHSWACCASPCRNPLISW